MTTKEILTNILAKHPIQHAFHAIKRHDGLINQINDSTSFLNDNATLSERVWNIMNDRTSKNVCSYGNPTNFHCFTKGYRPFCSNGNHCNCKKDHDRQKIKQRYAEKSSDEKEQIKQKRKETNKKLFGTEYALQNKELLEKAQKTTEDRYGTKQEQKELFGKRIKETWLEKYNVDHISKLETVKNKKKRASLEKYGTENPMMDKTVQKKAKETLKSNHGVTIPSQVSHFKEKTETTCLERYGVNNPSKIKTIKEKKVENSLKNFGCENPSMNQTVKDKTVATNYSRYGVHNPAMAHIDPMVYNYLKNKEWLETELLTRSIKEISDSFNVWPRVVRRYIKLHNIHVKSKSSYEDNFENIVKEWGVRFKRNTRSVLPSGLELDMYFPDQRVAVEINGLYWHSTDYKNINYHKDKWKECRDNGIRLISIFEDEWVYRKEQCLRFIKNVLGISNEDKVYARKCVVDECSFGEVRSILDENHIQGICSPSKTNICLKYNDKIVSVMIFSKRSDDCWELTRFCNDGVKVVGGASKLLNYFIKTYDPSEIVSFADCRWSDGGVYHTLKFNLDKIIKPDYSYIKNMRRYHKTNFRKSKLNRMGVSDGDIKTQTENMIMIGLGFKRIYDCGKMKFVWKK